MTPIEILRTNEENNTCFCEKLTLLFQIMSMLSTWKVYRGDSSDFKDLLFTVRKSQ